MSEPGEKLHIRDSEKRGRGRRFDRREERHMFLTTEVVPDANGQRNDGKT